MSVAGAHREYEPGSNPSSRERRVRPEQRTPEQVLGDLSIFYPPHRTLGIILELVEIARQPGMWRRVSEGVGKSMRDAELRDSRREDDLYTRVEALTGSDPVRVVAERILKTTLSRDPSVARAAGGLLMSLAGNLEWEEKERLVVFPRKLAEIHRKGYGDSLAVTEGLFAALGVVDESGVKPESIDARQALGVSRVWKKVDTRLTTEEHIRMRHGEGKFGVPNAEGVILAVDYTETKRHSAAGDSYAPMTDELRLSLVQGPPGPALTESTG